MQPISKESSFIRKEIKRSVSELINFLSSLLSAGCKTFPIVVVRTFISFTGFIHIGRRTRRMISSSYFCLWPDNIQSQLFRDTKKKTRVTPRLLQLSSDLTLHSRTQRLLAAATTDLKRHVALKNSVRVVSGREGGNDLCSQFSQSFSLSYFPTETNCFSRHCLQITRTQLVPFCLKLIVLLYKNKSNS